MISGIILHIALRDSDLKKTVAMHPIEKSPVGLHDIRQFDIGSMKYLARVRVRNK